MTGEIKPTIHKRRPVITIEWKIHNFFRLSTKMDSAVDSPTFTFMNDTWYIRMYSNGESEYDSLGWMGMYLMKNYSKTLLSHSVVYQLGIREESGDYVSRNFKYRFVKNGCGQPKFLERSTLLRDRCRIAPEDTLTIFCTIYSSIRETTQATLQATQTTPQTTEAASQTTQARATEAESQTTASKTTQTASQTIHPESSGFEKLSQDLMDLLLNSKDGDVVLKVKDKEFKVHRTILKARSPVFRAMFGNGMQETNSGVVDFTDCNPAAFQDFLRYLYSGRVKEFSTSKVFDLYLFADKYDVTELKVECVEFMMGNMSVDTFFEVITLALRHSEPELLERATNFFMDTASEIIMKAEWLSFLKDYHVEANELYMKALCKNSK